MKGIDYYKELPYTVQLIKNDDGTFFASIKELRGCMTEGDTLDEAYEMIEDAKLSWLSVAIEDGREIPMPESMNGKEFSGKLNLRLPKSMHKDLSKNAEEEGVSLNTYLNHLLSEKNAIFETQERVIKMLSQKLYERGNKEWAMEYESVFEVPRFTKNSDNIYYPSFKWTMEQDLVRRG